MYFRQLNVKRKLYLFVRWINKEEINHDRGRDYEHIKSNQDGGWDYHYGSNKTSFKLELVRD